YLSTLGTRDTALIANLTASTPNPFSGLNTAQNGSTTTPSQLLARFPEFPVGSGSGSTGVIIQNLTAGSSYFQALNVHVEHRLSNGLLLLGNYIHSKLIDRTTWLNDTDSAPEKRISPYDHPNRFVLGVVYGIPVGRGRKYTLQSRWLDLLAGGWDVSSIYTY